jgi:glycolate oxidase FAD binding subunit
MSTTQPTDLPVDPTLRRWAKRIQDAAAAGRALRVSGAGTHGFLYDTDDPESDVLDTREHSGVVSYEPTELVVTVKTGTPLAELEAVLAEQGQYLPFEPPHLGPGGTVGGMVAAGLSGPARASVGAVRDYVLGVELINGKGEHLTFGGQVMKNVAGYDVSRLMAGSRGRLGVLTQVSLKVLPRAPAEATLCFVATAAQALKQLASWRQQPLPLNASCWVHDDTGAVAQDLLFVRLRGAFAAVEAACLRMLADLPGQRMDPAVAQPDWAACRDQTLPFFQAPADHLGLWRLSVPPTWPVLDLPWPQLVEWHGGQRWLWAPTDMATTQTLRETAAQAGGHTSLFRAPKLFDHLPLRDSPVSAAVNSIEQRLLQAFDPAGVFSQQARHANPSAR